MADYNIPAGTEVWDVPLNANLTDINDRLTVEESTSASQGAAIAVNSANISTNTSNIATNTADITTLQGQTAANTGNIATNTTNIATNTADIATANSNISTLQTQSTQVRNGHWLPSDHNMVAWNMDPSEAANGQLLVSGTVYYIGLQIRANTSFSNVIVPVNAVGATLTAGQNLVGVYNSAGTRIAISADQSANWTTLGTKTVPMIGAPIALTPGLYYVAIMSNGTTPITILRESNITNSPIINIGLTAATARVSELAGQTALAASTTPSGRTLSLFSLWTAIS